MGRVLRYGVSLYLGEWVQITGGEGQTLCRQSLWVEFYWGNGRERKGTQSGLWEEKERREEGERERSRDDEKKKYVEFCLLF